MDAPLIEVHDVTKVYGKGASEVSALKGVSLTVNKGEFVAIMGASGSGKSTFMHLLGCLDHPTAGSYKLSGKEVSGLSQDQLAEVRGRQIGFVFQSFNLLSRTSALENVELPMLYTHEHLSSAVQREHAIHALQIVGLADRAGHHPNQLSGGQQQRVAIARALVNKPAVLLADEPTGNLDTRTSVEVMGVFQRLNDAGITIVMVTHELDIAAFTKRNVIMRDGLVVNDTLVEHRSFAEEEIRRLEQAQQAVKLSA